MNVKVVGIFALLVVLCVFMAVMTAEPWYNVMDSTFLQPNNIENLLRRTAMYGVLGIGVAFVIITGGIDLSVGSVVCLSGCLLAIFLHVDYQAFDHQQIFRVRGRDRVILVEGKQSGLQPGDRIRFSGGRRASNALLTIEDVQTRNVPVRDDEPQLDEGDGGAGAVPISIIRVDQPLSSDDRHGQIAKVYDLVSFDLGQLQSEPPVLPSVVIQGDHAYLDRRDRLVLVHPSAGLKQLTVDSVALAGSQTTVTLTRDLGSDFSAEWLAIPLERWQRMSIPLALAFVLSIGLVLGLLHGLLVTRMKLQPFVVTLCGLLIYRGMSRWLVSDQPVGFGTEFESTLSPLGAGKLGVAQWETASGTATFGIPYPFFILLITAVFAAVFLNKTIWGRYLLALGRNEEAARYSGINTRRITMIAFVISTGLAATGGTLFALDANSVSPSSFGNFFELYAIAAAVLGGCSLRGGEGSIAGVIIGTAVMQILYNLIVLIKISGTLEFAIIGLVILFGVVADELIKRVAASRRAIAQAKAAAN
jgi:ribose transport system permease protein